MLGDQRSVGRRALLHLIRRAGPIPRIALSEQTGISRATVTTVTAELLEHGLIKEIEVSAKAGELKRGRPKIDLQIRGEAYLVAGIKLAHQSVSIVINDFAGTQIGEYYAKLQITTFSPAHLVDLIAEHLEHAADNAGISIDKISAVGLGLAGIVDVQEGLVRWSPSLETRNVKLRDALEKRMSKPVFLDNDANLVAKAEQYFGMGRDVSDFIVVTIENGVGMGIVLSDTLYRGTRGCGAEFGHMKVQLDGALCRCGQRGCLEAYVADYAVLREMATGQSAEAPPKEAQEMTAFVAAAKSGDKKAMAIMERASHIFAMGLSNLINIFDPKLIILSGERMQFDFLYADDVLARIKDLVVQVDAAPPEIVVHKWGDMMWAKGAAAYAIEGISEISLAQLGA